MEPRAGGSQTMEAGGVPATTATAGLPWLAILWILALLIVLFFPVLRLMVKEWATDEDMGHAFLVPLVAGYIMWQERARILAQPVKPFWPGLVLVFWAFCPRGLAFPGAGFLFARPGFS